MTGGAGTGALREIGALFGPGTVAGMTDGQLLGRFLDRRDEGAELAFAALVARHGPMVLGVCRRALADPGDAEDAFQATFLILARKARSVRVDDSLGRWLYGVSRKVAARARAVAARRPRLDSGSFGAIEARSPDPDRFEVRATIDEELARLPDAYRSAVVLCDLGGLTHEEAARDLGCPVGTIKSRLTRGRARLRASLGRRGLAPSTRMAAPVVPARLAEAAARASEVSAVGGASASGVVPASAVALAEGMLRTMTVIKLKLAAAALLSIGLAASGAGVMARQEKGDAKSTVSGAPDARIAAEGPPAPKDLARPTESDLNKLAALLDELKRLQKRHAAASRIARDPKDPAIARALGEIREVEAEIAQLAKRDGNLEDPTPGQVALAGRTEARLDEPVTINVTEQQLGSVIALLQEQTGINLILDPKAMGESGVTRGTPVTLKAEKVKLSVALRLLLRPIGLTYKVEADVVLITAPGIDREARARIWANFVAELFRARRILATTEERLAHAPNDPAVARARKRVADLESAVEQFQEVLSTFADDDSGLAGAPGRNRTPWPKGGPREHPGEFTKVSMPDYVVEPPDIIRVEVLQALEGRPITGERLVRPDGKISLGFYGEVYVAGLTTREIKEKVILHLRDFLDDKQLGLKRSDPTPLRLEDVPPARSDRVSVDVDSYNSKVYYVQGEVGSPGRLPITGNETVLDAINYAGGLRPSASKTSTRVVRPDPKQPGTEHYLMVDLAAIVDRGDSRTNYQILPGDRLIVYRDPKGAPDRAEPADRGSPGPEGVEARLQTVERKLDDVLKALERVAKP